MMLLLILSWMFDLSRFLTVSPFSVKTTVEMEKMSIVKHFIRMQKYTVTLIGRLVESFVRSSVYLLERTKEDNNNTNNRKTVASSISRVHIYVFSLRPFSFNCMTETLSICKLDWLAMVHCVGCFKPPLSTNTSIFFRQMTTRKKCQKLVANI